MTFEFRYGDTWYKYEGGWIYKKGGFGNWDHYCPVLCELNEQIENFTEDQVKVILCAILHGYIWGRKDGKKEKIQEFKRVFQID